MHPEVLDKKAAGLLPIFANLRGFYLAGGTALALEIGHRLSVDFDFFSNDAILPALLPQLEKLAGGKKITLSVNNADELTVFIDGIKTTFLHYPFPCLFPFREFEKIKLAAPEEIAVMKAYTIGRRGSFRDYADLYFILKNKISSLTEIVENAQKKYGEIFDPRLFLEQLVYFKDIQDTELKFLGGKVDFEKLEKFFREKVAEIKL